MARIPLSMSLVSLAVLAACTTYDRVTPAPGAVVVEPPKTAAATPAGTIVAPVVVAPAPAAAPAPVAALRAGSGRIESIAAGTGNSRRIGVRMDDGSLQLVNSDAPNLAIGDRIELTADGQARRAGSSSVVLVTPSTEPSTVVVPSATTLRPGVGRIESMAAVPSAAAGGGRSSTKRLGVKMADGSIQFVDTEAIGLALGDRIELTADGLLRRPVP